MCFGKSILGKDEEKEEEGRIKGMGSKNEGSWSTGFFILHTV